MRTVYLDANATTPVLPEVLGAMLPYFTDQFGNASSIHGMGQRARAAVERARIQTARMLHCLPSEVVFTSGGTESDNLAIFGLLRPGDHLLTSSIEHHAVLHAAEAARSRGIEVTFLRVDAAGLVSPSDVRAAIGPETRLVSVMLANNETGIIQPVAEISRILEEANASRANAHLNGAEPANNILLHTDAVQGAGKLSLDVTRLGCQLLSISGHKMHAPLGVGVLYVRRGIQLQPLFFGGAHERQRRAGTENLPGIVGFGKAAELATEAVDDGVTIPRIAALRDRLERELLARIPKSGVNGAYPDGTIPPRVANTTSLWFQHVEGEALLISLDLKGIAASGGSACQSGAMDPSHVLVAMGVPREGVYSSLRFSLMKTTTDADIDDALEIVPAAVARLRELSPAWRAEQEHQAAVA